MRRAVVRLSRGRGSGEHPLMWRRDSNASLSLWLASLLLLVAALGPAAARTPGFPCKEHEWVNVTWHPPQEPQCHSCYKCTVGQTCRQRGGCFNCAPGEFDDDSNPLKPCVACPAGKTSQEEAATACTVKQQSLSLWGQVMQLDTSVQVACGSGLLVLILVVVAWCCTGRHGGLRGLCKQLLGKCNIEMAEPANGNSSSEVHEAGGVGRGDTEDPAGESSHLLAVGVQSEDAPASRCWRCRRCCRGKYGALPDGKDTSAYVRVRHRKNLAASTQKIVAQPVQQRDYDFFINHCQASGQDQCGKLALLLRARGAKVWYDMSAEDLTEQGMEQGVANSRNMLVFLSDGLMSRPFCRKEQRWAIQYGCKFVGVAEFDDRHGGGKNEEGVDLFTRERATAPEDLKFLFDQVEFEPFQRREHLVETMVTQIGKRGGCRLDAAPLPGSPFPASARDPQPETDLAELCRRSSMAAGKVVERKQDFSNRRQLRQDLSGWALSAKSREPGCILLGGPGAGKTTLLTELVEDESSDFHAAVLATHFCVAHDVESLKPMSFVAGVAMQLYKGCRPYRQYVDAAESVQGKVKKLFSGDTDGEPLSSFVDLVLALLKKACPGSERPAEGGFVLCIDSLDEALLPDGVASGPAGSIVQLLKTCSSKRLFPPWLKVLATSRDVPAVAQLTSWRSFDLGAEARLEENREAIRAYINIRLDAAGSPLRARVDEMTELEPEMAELEPEQADKVAQGQFHCNALAHPYFAALVEQSGGNFLYAATALNDVEEGMGDLADVGSLPSGLDELFLHFFDRLFESADSVKYRRVRPIFEVIAASEGGVSEAALLACLRTNEPTADERELKAALLGVRQFLKTATAASGQDVLVFYHLSFREWLQQEHGYKMTVSCGHRALAVVLFAAMAEPLTDSLSDAFAAACVAQLECDESLQGRHIRKMRPRTPLLQSGEAVLELASHLAQALDASCGRAAVFAELFEGAIDLEAQAEPTESDLALSLEDFMGRCGVENYHRYIAGSAICTARDLRQATLAELTAAMPSSWGGKFGAREHADHIAKMVQPTRGRLAAQLASAGGPVACLRLLLDLGVDTGVTDKLGRTLVHLAAQHGRVDELCLLVESVDGGSSLSESTDVHGKTPLMWAAEKGQEKALQLLLSARIGAELEAKDKYGLTALHWAATNGQLGALQLLLSEGVGAELETKDKWGRTPLHLAAANGQVEALRLLLSEGLRAELEAKTKNGRTALHCAAQTGQVEALRLLLSAKIGAELEAKTKNGRTALHCAAQTGQREVLRLLLSAEIGAELEAKDERGLTAVHVAAQNGQVEALRLLLGVGAELEDKSEEGRTALHWAALAGQVEAIDTLVELGASLDPDGDGGVHLLKVAGLLCKGNDSAEKKVATVASLRRLGCTYM
eukprot:COSAG01_NODE_58_length_30193_cov_12.302020_1_plen_1409_part_00